MQSNFITFLDEPFDAIICIDGDLPGSDFFNQFSKSKIIAADGAANKFHKKNTKPDLIIGDLDSVKKNVLDNIDSEIIKIESQETNDFEKALLWCKNKNFTDILVTGFHGGELEHTLNNWSVFIKYSSLLNLTIFDLGRYGFVLKGNNKINLAENEIVSLIPQPKATLTTKNLKWELSRGKLELGQREGARNLTISSQIQVNVLSGEILFFCKSRAPYKPIIKKVT